MITSKLVHPIIVIKVIDKNGIEVLRKFTYPNSNCFGKVLAGDTVIDMFWMDEGDDHESTTRI